jgi:hypothetical protein
MRKPKNNKRVGIEAVMRELANEKLPVVIGYFLRTGDK